MKQITQATVHVASTRPMAAFRLPPRLVILIVIVLVFTTANLVTWVFGGTTPDLPDPFAVMSDFFPGQSGSTLEARGFRCTATYIYESPPHQNCILWPTDGAFFQVKVLLSQNVITLSEFQIRGNSLRIGDLMLLWGEPKTRYWDHQVYLAWYDRSILATADSNSRGYSLFLPVSMVYIFDNPMK